jgi:hypothetical protein
MTPAVPLLVVALVAGYHKVVESAIPTVTLWDHMIQGGSVGVLTLLLGLWQYSDPATVVASGVLMVME